MADEKVKCANCGYLSGKKSPSDPEFQTVSPQWRKTGLPPSGAGYAPYCFKGVAAPNDEYEQQKSSGDGKKAAFLAVIGTERACPDYCACEPGRTPQEHAEMMTAREVSERAASEQDKNRAWQAAEAEKNRKAQAEESERNRKAQAEEAERNRQAQAEQNRLQRASAEQLAEKDRRAKLMLWVLGGVGAVLFAVGGFFGGRHFAPPAEKKDTHTPTAPAPATKPY